jgi:preprotein translocase subunit SecA
VEGANFDVRKHLLEYDDVLNSQRAKIYGQRNLIFTKEDLSEDALEMLRTEVNQRVPLALQDPEGPWKLLAWLDQTQPPLQLGSYIYPSYSLTLLARQIASRARRSDRPPIQSDSSTPLVISRDELVGALLDIAAQSLQSEEDHLLGGVQEMLDQARQRFKSQLDERIEAVGNFFYSLRDADETDTRTPRQLVDELASIARLPLKLSPEHQRALRSPNGRAELEDVQDEVQEQVENSLMLQSVMRLVGSVERRLEDTLDINSGQLAGEDWDDLEDGVVAAVREVYEKRRQRLLGKDGQITRDLEAALGRAEGYLAENALYQLLILLPQGTRATFDKRTHRRILQRTTRLSYVYYAARLLENRDPQEITQEVLAHLEQAQSVLHRAWGSIEWSRLANTPLSGLDSLAQHDLMNALGEERFQQVSNLLLQELVDSDRENAVRSLGRRALTEVFRQLLLSVISELWVDYLTQMEALRVSIGLEAYAQRDPLVQYKTRASALFQELLANMRLGVVSRMFTYAPRNLSSVQTGTSQPEAEQVEEEIAGEEQMDEEGPEIVSEPDSGAEQPTKGKRRRRRRR